MSANELWGGRFAKGPAEIMERINASIDFDRRLYRQDITGSLAHSSMLMAKSIISRADGEKIQDGLRTILREIEAGNFKTDPALEDIHMHVEARLRELIGDAAGRLHTGRSRNDQVATDMRLWVRDTMDHLNGELKDLQTALVNLADAEAGTVMPGFTHLQAAQPVTFGHHMLAYLEMFARDRSRLADARERLNECPLGSAALAGTSFPIDRDMTAKELGFDRPTANSLDGVSDRDFALEFLGFASICSMHLSRLAEEIVIWSSAQFRFVECSDSFSTGSSIMPQKKNPDAAELIRGKAGRSAGAFTSLLMMMKGLPMTYGKDMQEDKEPVFDAADNLQLCLAAMTGMISDLTINRDVLKAASGAGFATATDLADWLVRSLDMPFRNAHHVTGALVKLAETKNCGLEDLTLEQMQSVEGAITNEVFDVLGVDNSVASRVSYGGTAPSNVMAQVKRWKDLLAGDA